MISMNGTTVSRCGIAAASFMSAWLGRLGLLREERVDAPTTRTTLPARAAWTAQARPPEVAPEPDELQVRALLCHLLGVAA